MSNEDLVLQKLGQIEEDIKEVKKTQARQSDKVDELLIQFVKHKTSQDNKYLECRAKNDERYVLVTDVTRHITEVSSEKQNATYKFWSHAKDVVSVINIIILLLLATSIL